MAFLRLAAAALTAALLTTAAAPAAQTTAPNAAVLKTVNAVLTASANDDLKLLHAQYAPTSTIVDEFAPFVWSGANAQDVWFADFGKVVKAYAMTDVKFKPGAAKYTYTAATQAYVVVPVTLTATLKGKPYTESGLFAFALRNDGTAWKIVSQSWAKSSENFNAY